MEKLKERIEGQNEEAIYNICQDLTQKDLIELILEDKELCIFTQFFFDGVGEMKLSDFDNVFEILKQNIYYKLTGEKNYIKQFFEPTNKVLNDIVDSFEEKPKNKLLTTLDFLMLMSLFNDDSYVRKSFENATYKETINKLKSEIK